MPSLRSQTRKNQQKHPAKNNLTGSIQNAPEEMQNQELTPMRSKTPPAKAPPAGMKSPSVLIQNHLPLPPTQTSANPSPYQVISDNIDATSHEIIMQETLSRDAYVILGQRLDYYMELMDHNVGVEIEDEELVIKDAHTRNRVFIAMMVLAICSIPAYPGDENQAGSMLSSFTANEWKKLRDEMGTWRETMKELFATVRLQKRTREIERLHVSIVRRMEAMEALVHLKSELESSSEKLENGKTNSEDLLAHPTDCIDDYIDVTADIREELGHISKTLYSEFFIPEKTLSSIKLDDVGKAKKSIASLIRTLGRMFDRNAMPIEGLQIDIVRLAQECNDLLPVPTLVKVGYFANPSLQMTDDNEEEGFEEGGGFELEEEEEEEEEAEDERKMPAKTAPSTPSRSVASAARPSSEKKIYDSSDDEAALKIIPRPSVAIKKNKRRREKETTMAVVQEHGNAKPRTRKKSPKKAQKSPSKRKRDKVDDDSDMETNTSVATPKRGKKRVRYSEEEKRCLLEGVEKIGMGCWAQIRDHYADVFSVNQRTSVNLKDLYRTLTKDNPQE
jgi:hypothetical protein